MAKTPEIPDIPEHERTPLCAATAGGNPLSNGNDTKFEGWDCYY